MFAPALSPIGVVPWRSSPGQDAPLYQQTSIRLWYWSSTDFQSVQASCPSRSTPSSNGLAACVMHPRAASRETVWTGKRHHITRLAPALRLTRHRVRRGDHQAPPVNVHEGRVSQLERLESSGGSRTTNSIPAHRPVARPTATFRESVRRGDLPGDAAATIATHLYEGIADTIVQ